MVEQVNTGPNKHFNDKHSCGRSYERQDSGKQMAVKTELQPNPLCSILFEEDDRHKCGSEKEHEDEPPTTSEAKSI